MKQRLTLFISICALIVGAQEAGYADDTAEIVQDATFGVGFLGAGIGAAAETARVVELLSIPEPTTATKWEAAKHAGAALLFAGAAAGTMAGFLMKEEGEDGEGFDHDDPRFPDSPPGPGDPGSGPWDTTFETDPTGGGSWSDPGTSWSSDELKKASTGSLSDRYAGSGLDVAADLINPNPDSGFGLASLKNDPNGSRALSSTLGSDATGTDGSGSYGSGSSDAMAEAIERQLSTMDATDLAKLRAGDEKLVSDLMQSLGLNGDPNGISFDMFNNILKGMLNRDGEQPRYNGVLLADLVDDNQSIWQAVKTTNNFAFTGIIEKIRKAKAPTQQLIAKSTTENENKETPRGSLLRTKIMK